MREEENGVSGGEGTDAPVEAPVPRSRSSRGLAVRALQIVAGVTLAALLLGWGLPWVTDTPWSTILATVTSIGWGMLAYLLALMFLGLYCYTFTLMGSMPGLTHGQALMANLAGSGVSNVLPAGGAVGAGLTYAIFRSWGFSHRRISTSIIVTTVWNILARVLLPVLAAIVLLPDTHHLPPAMFTGALAGGLGGAAVAGALVAVLASRRSARSVGRLGNALFGPVVRRLRPGRRAPDAQELALDLRAKMMDLVRAQWPRLTFGLVGFMGVYYVLFHECLRAVGAQTSWPVAFAAFAVGRLLTTVAVTPGGIGVTEAGAAVVLVALGTPGEIAAAGVTLFALFSHLLEIPFGAVAVLSWHQSRDWYLRRRPGGVPRPRAAD